jgi:polysaccharide export outer membrane protein
MRPIILLNSCLILLLAAVGAESQIFPTLDPNASPAVTKQVTVPPPPPAPQPAPAPAQTPAPAPVQPAATPSDSLASKAAAADDATKLANLSQAYVLGPQDTVAVRVVDEDLGDDPYPIDLQGYLTLPRVGRVYAAGLTVEQLQMELTKRYREYLQEPAVTVNVTEYRSQPVSVLGAVGTPGVRQIRGQKTLFEVISEAGGLKPEAGNKITITRQMANGPLPLPNAVTDASGRYSIADINIRAVMSASNPADNIAVKPYDVITVPRADLIYVIGAVKKAGGFPLQERANMTVLEALSLAEGLDKTASSKKAKILRNDEVTHARTELPVNVKSILEGKSDDLPLLSNDILVIPSSQAKAATYRALEAVIQTGTGIAIYH